MNMTKKIFLLAKIGGLCLGLAFLMLGIYVDVFLSTKSMLSSYPLSNIYQSAKQTIFIAFIGAVLTTIFGAPALIFADKYLRRYKARYVFCGVIASYLLWTLFNSFPQYYGDWTGRGLYHVGIYLSLGLLVSLIFTEACRRIEAGNVAD